MELLNEIDRICELYTASKAKIQSSTPKKVPVPKWKDVKGKFGQFKPNKFNTQENTSQPKIHGFFVKSSNSSSPLSKINENSPFKRNAFSENDIAQEFQRSNARISEASEPFWNKTLEVPESHHFDPIAGAKWIFPS